jgi:hypothetical protein
MTTLRSEHRRKSPAACDISSPIESDDGRGNGFADPLTQMEFQKY